MEPHGVSNHWQLNCQFNSMPRLLSKERSKIRIAGPLWGKPLVTGGLKILECIWFIKIIYGEGHLTSYQWHRITKYRLFTSSVATVSAAWQNTTSWDCSLRLACIHQPMRYDAKIMTFLNTYIYCVGTAGPEKSIPFINSWQTHRSSELRSLIRKTINKLFEYVTH